MMYFYMIIMTSLGAFAALFLKKASGSNTIKSLLTTRNLYISGGLYLFSACMNIYVLRILPYSVVFPMTSMTYIWVMVISYFVLKEKISVKKIVGVILIIIGVVLLTTQYSGIKL